MKRRRKNPAELALLSANPMRKRRNPAELALMSANPRRNPYDRLSTEEKLAFGRLGLGKAQLQSKRDIARARKKVADVLRFRNRLPNPGALPSLDAPQAEHARELREAFTESPSERYTVREEPHIPAGDYALLGRLVALRVKPEIGGQVQEISPEGHVLVVSNASGRQIYFVGDGQELAPPEIAIFSAAETSLRPELGTCRSIVYEAAKWHQAVPGSARGKVVEWEHQFGEDGGYPPRLHYHRAYKRFMLEGGTYHVEGAGIVN